MQVRIECKTQICPNLPLDTVVLNAPSSPTKRKPAFSQHALTSGVLHHGICVHSSHSQLVKSDFYGQTLCLRSISFSLYRVVFAYGYLECILFFIMLDLFQLQFPHYLISKHDCKQPARSVLTPLHQNIGLPLLRHKHGAGISACPYRWTHHSSSSGTVRGIALLSSLLAESSASLASPKFNLPSCNS